jgi:hypothetical protein
MNKAKVDDFLRACGEAFDRHYIPAQVLLGMHVATR